jgi:hypothetical protein
MFENICLLWLSQQKGGQAAGKVKDHCDCKERRARGETKRENPLPSPLFVEETS